MLLRRESAPPSGSRRRPPSAVPGAGAQGSAPRRAGPSASPAKPTRGCAAGAVARRPGAPGPPRWCAGQPGARPASESRNSCSATLKPRFSSFPRSSSRVPGTSRSASQARLNQTAFTLPLASDTSACEDRQAPAPSRPQLRAAHLDLDGRLLPQPQLPDADRLGPITVAVGDVAQQIAEARDLHLGRRARQLRARSAQLGDRRIENRRARRRLQRRLQQRLALQDFPGSQFTRRVDLGRDRVAVEGGLHRHLG